MANVQVNQHLAAARADGFPLTVSEFVPEKVSERPPVLLIACATACPRSFYRHFARYMAGRYGFIALTFDYRGMGDSFVLPKAARAELLQKASLARGNDPNVSHGLPADALTDDEFAELRDQFIKENRDINIADHYALRDTEGVLQWAAARYGLGDADGRLVFVGHSVGGHVLPMCPSRSLVARVLLVSANSAYRRFNTSWVSSQYFFNLLMPVGNAVYGYFPGKKIGIFENIPIGVADQWKSWSLQPKYMCHDPARERLYREYQVPIIMLSFHDDMFSTPAGFDSFLGMIGPETGNLYCRTHIHFYPADLGEKAIGHNGFFWSKSSRLWDAFSEYLLRGVPYRTKHEVLGYLEDQGLSSDSVSASKL